MKLLYNFLIFICIIFFFSCKNNEIETGKLKKSVAEWNFLVYMGADNNLERFAIENLYDMKKQGLLKI